MKLTRISLLIIASLLTFNISVATAADTANKMQQLTEWEKKKIAEEFNRFFKSTDNGAFQKLNKNPWASKRARQQQQAQKVLKISASLGSCKQYTVKQRRQCYAQGNGKAMCERYFKARMDHCSEYF